jgi:hypothetical protein
MRPNSRLSVCCPLRPVESNSGSSRFSCSLLNFALLRSSLFFSALLSRRRGEARMDARRPGLPRRARRREALPANYAAPCTQTRNNGGSAVKNYGFCSKKCRDKKKSPPRPPAAGRTAKKCKHWHDKSQCRDCGTGHCVHGRRKGQCKECGTCHYCQHGRRGSACASSAQTPRWPKTVVGFKCASALATCYWVLVLCARTAPG